MLKVGELVRALERIAPPGLAEPWDAVGLALGSDDEPLRSSRVLLTIDLTSGVLDEALEGGVGAIVSYHPPIFKPIGSITPAAAKGSVLLRAARAGLAIYSPHTALDAVVGGVADWLLDLSVPGGAGAIASRRAITAAAGGARAKLVFFAPVGTEDGLVDAVSRAGGGEIGGYTNCSFQSRGVGTFLGGQGTSPAIGRAGVYERVEEARVEMVVPVSRAEAVIAALRAAHPYEEPAFDLMTLHAVGDAGGSGAGRVATLDRGVSIEAIAASVRDGLGVRRVRVAVPDGVEPSAAVITTIGVCPGSGGSLLDAAGARGIGCFVTGEMTHHHVLAAVQRGVAVVLAGHTNTERGYLPGYGERIERALPGIAAVVSGVDRWPIVEM